MHPFTAVSENLYLPIYPILFLYWWFLIHKLWFNFPYYLFHFCRFSLLFQISLGDSFFNLSRDGFIFTCFWCKTSNENYSTCQCMSSENWPDFCFSSGLESAGILWKSSFSLNSSEKKKIGKRSLKWFYHLEVELTVEILSIIPNNYPWFDYFQRLSIGTL